MDTAPTLRSLGFYTEAEVAAIYGVKLLTLRNWRCKGIGPPFTRVHRHLIAYPITALRKDLDGRTVRPGRQSLRLTVPA